jgi:DNA-binding HxlR family transcriptional regulator
MCPSRDLLDLIADKWAVLVLSAIREGDTRNGTMLRAVDGISQKSLTRTLRDLERNGLVNRHDFREVPPRVEYELSDLGLSLVPILRSMCRWTVKHIEEVNEARREHDQRERNRARRAAA